MIADIVVKKSRIKITVILAATLFITTCLPSFCQWGRVGLQPQEDTRSVAFCSGAAFAGEKRFGVHYSLTGDEWLPTWLDEFNLAFSNDGWITHEVPVVNTVVASGATVIAGTSNGKVYYSSTPMNTTAPWLQSAFSPSIAGGAVMQLVLAPDGDIYACVSGGTSPGIYFSSNLGASFSMLAGTIGTGLFMDIAFFGTSSSEFWAVTLNDAETQSGGIYHWTGSWDDISPVSFHGFSSVAVSATGTGDGPDYIWVGDLQGAGLLQSANQGGLWTSPGTVCDPVLSLLTPSSGQADVFVGTGNGFKELASGAVSDLYPTNLAINTITEAVDGSFWLATSSGVKRTIPGETFPRDVAVETMALFDISNITTSPNYLTDGVIFALSERVGLFISRDGGTSFSMYMPPLSQSQASDPGFRITGFGVDPTFNGATGSCGATTSTVYLATKGMGVFKSTSGGSNWIPINNGVLSTNLNVCKFAVTPNVFGYPLFAATCNMPSILRYNGSGDTWEATALLDPVPGEITAIAFPPGFPSPSTVFVGADTGLYVSQNGGGNFTFVNAAQFPVPPSGQTKVTGIAFHPSYDNNSQTLVFVVRGGSLFRGTCTVGTWTFELVEGSAGAMLPSQPFIDKVALSPHFLVDNTLAATFVNPNSITEDGIWMSNNGGISWTAINGSYPSILKDRFPNAIKFVVSPAGVRLLVGTRKERLFFSDSSNYAAWNQATGWETSPSCVNAMAVSSVPTGFNCFNASAKPTDIFLGTCKGVFWSNDGGANFRPINEGLTTTVSNNGCTPFSINALHVESACVSAGCLGGTNLTVLPVLIAGTEGKGIWYRHARPIFDQATFVGWDWSTNPETLEPVWHQAIGFSPSGTVKNFSREKNLRLLTGEQVIRAGTDIGAFSSSGLAATLGHEWLPIGLSGEIVTGICHGVDGSGLKESLPDPKAPSGGTVWGTVWGTGVKKGTGATLMSAIPQPLDITWETRNGTGAGTLSDLYQQSVIQLTDGTVLAGTGETMGIAGVYRTPDEGQTIWYLSSSGIENTTRDIVEFLECSSNQDVFCAVEGSSSDGGIFISADKGNNWVSISSGFDSVEQTLADIIETEGTPPVYYAGTFSRGSYATTITPLTAPTISSIDVSSGSSSGGTTVTITGTNFQCSCPTNYTCLTGKDKALASFGGIDAATTSCTSTQLVVTSPQHPTGKVAVKVRNPDTRLSSSSQQFTYTDGSNVEITLARDGSNNIVVSWTGSGSPSKAYRSTKPDFTGWVKTTGVSSSPYTYSDESGTDSLIYYFRVE